MRIQQNYVILEKQESPETTTNSGLKVSDKFGQGSQFEFWYIKQVGKDCTAEVGSRVMISKKEGRKLVLNELTRNIEDKDVLRLVKESDILIIF